MSKDVQRTIIRHGKDQREAPKMKKNIEDERYEKQAFNYIKKLRVEDKLNYTVIADRLMAEGWSGPNGSKLTQPSVSTFMVDRGFNVLNGPKKRKRKSEGAETLSFAIPANASPLDVKIFKILNANLDMDIKIIAIKSVLQDTENSSK